MNFASSWDAQSAVAQQRREAMLARIGQLRALEQRPEQQSLQARPSFEQRGQLLPRERVGLLLDPGAPWLPLCALAGYLQDDGDPERSVPGAGVIAGIGFVRGVRCMVAASDSGIDAGALQPMGLEKMLRVQEIALAHRLPFVHLAESAGANLQRYKVEEFVQGGALLRNFARLSGAGIPVIAVQHGADTGGGEWLLGLSDIAILVRGGSGVAGLQGGGSGLGEYLAEDDRHALGIARQVLAQLAPTPALSREREREKDSEGGGEGAREDLLTLMPATPGEPVDAREIMVRLVDGASLLEFKSLHGPGTVCAQGSIAGHAVGFIGNNEPIDVAGASKATHFIQWMCQLGHPIVYLQNTTGALAGRESERAGMIAHGSRLIQAVTHASVPQLTIQCGTSFGAGNYGMCGRAYAPRFLFSWPGARTGVAPDPERSREQHEGIVDLFESQADALHTSGLLLDDGVIDPRDTRAVLAFCLDTIAQAEAKKPRTMQFGVART